MATTNATVEFRTDKKRHYSIQVTEVDGHTISLEYLNSSKNWKPIKDADGNDIVETADFQGTFTAPTTKGRLLVVPGASDFDYDVTPTSDS